MEIDLSRLDARTRAVVDGQFQDTFHRQLRGAIVNQTRTARANRNGTPWKSDFGPKDTEIDPFIDALWTAQYGHNYRENRDLMRFLKRRNEEIAGRARSGKSMVGYERQTLNTKHQTPNTKQQTSSRTGCRFGPGTLDLAA